MESLKLLWWIGEHGLAKRVDESNDCINFPEHYKWLMKECPNYDTVALTSQVGKQARNTVFIFKLEITKVLSIVDMWGLTVSGNCRQLSFTSPCSAGGKRWTPRNRRNGEMECYEIKLKKVSGDQDYTKVKPITTLVVKTVLCWTDILTTWSIEKK